MDEEGIISISEDVCLLDCLHNFDDIYGKEIGGEVIDWSKPLVDFREIA